MKKSFLALLLIFGVAADSQNVPPGTPLWISSAGGSSGGGTPGGSPNSVQYNNAGAFGGVGPVNSAVVVTNGSGVPSESVTLPNGIVATTQTAGDNSTKVATTAYVNTAATPPATTVLTTTTPTCTWVSKGSYSETLTGNTTITFAGTTDNYGITVTLSNTGSNTYTVTWTSQGGFTLEWPNNVTPVMTTGAHTDTYFFHCVGTIVYGSAVQNYSP